MYALKEWQSEKIGCKLFLADYDSSYFIHVMIVEKFFESDMLYGYEKQTSHLYDDFSTLLDRTRDKSSLL